MDRMPVSRLDLKESLESVKEEIGIRFDGLTQLLDVRFDALIGKLAALSVRVDAVEKDARFNTKLLVGIGIVGLLIGVIMDTIMRVFVK